MGSWFAVKNGVGYIFAAVAAVVEADIRERFKCMVIDMRPSHTECFVLIVSIFLRYS